MDISLYVNMMNVALLLAIGKLIKSSRFCNKIPNDLIPYILVIIGVIFQFILDGFSNVGTSVASGIISASVAVGLHQGGKKLFIRNNSVNIEDNSNENVG